MKRKITYTVEVDPNDDPEKINKKAVGRQIRVLAVIHGEVFAQWGRDLGVSRQAINNVIHGHIKSKKIQSFIEETLKKKFW